ncbi:MAG: Uma2 family endonuclease [Planctomycetia bacterium]|nr:Uma2 family endonuclease [Planctomycetia bacterium]
MSMPAPAAARATSKRCAAAIVIEGEQGAVRLPACVVDLESFRHWADSDEFPERGRYCYLGGIIWVDVSMEELLSHNQVKAEYARVLGNIVVTDDLGRFFPDGAALSNTDADLFSIPDGLFVSWTAFRDGRVQLKPRAQAGFTELIGSPDMALEVVSDSSVEKDTRDLPQLYWQAGVLEYWLVDVRGGKLRFDILRRGKKGFTATRRQAGWLKSAVFGRSFQLVQATDPLGHPRFVLNVRD